MVIYYEGKKFIINKYTKNKKNVFFIGKMKFICVFL